MSAGYTLPVVADVFYKAYTVLDAQIPAAGDGYLWLQANERRVSLVFKNRGAGSVVFIGETINSLAKGAVFAIEPTDLLVELAFPPRNQLFAWKTGTTDFRYMELVMQPYSQGAGKIRSNMQSV